jgi:hypothetical protein
VIVIIIIAAGSIVGHDAASLQAFTNLSLAGAAIAAMIVNGPARSPRAASASSRSNGPAQSRRVAPRSDGPAHSRRVAAVNGRAWSRLASLGRTAIVGVSVPPHAAAGGVR